MNIAIINGPNLNLLGKREPEVYGNKTFEDYFEVLRKEFENIRLEYFQSNVEGELIDELHRIGVESDYKVILNAGGYTHTSVAIRDAISAINAPVMEVHISNIYAREEFRQKSLLSEKCIGVIAGLGLNGYRLGIMYFLEGASNT